MLAEALQPLKDAIAAASSAGTPLRITGHGSKDFYGGEPQGELLSTQALNGVTAYEPSELFVSVLAGTPIAGLEALLAQHGAEVGRQMHAPPRHLAGAATM
jgi:glycolate oxidase FAD binding subunit